MVPGRAPEEEKGSMDLRVHGLFLDDKLGRDGCPNLPGCRAIVLALRQGFINYELTKRLFLSYGPLDALEIPPDVVANGFEALATIDLDGLSSIEDALEQARVRTEKRGRVNREIERARRNGYYVRTFPYALHIPDIVAIHHSKPIRNQRPMTANYLKTVDQMGGAPTAPVDEASPPCPHHHWESWGVFQPLPGYRQGAVVTGEKLVGYIRLRRSGNTAWYNKIMGHGDHLGQGIMYLLHFELLRHLLETRPAGLRHLIYHQYRNPRGDTLFDWKRKVLFDPRWAIYEDDRPWSFGDDRASVPVPLKLRHVEAVVAGDRAALCDAMRRSGASIEQVRRWTRAWLRDPGLLRFTFDPDEVPGRDALAALASNAFPREVLDGVASVHVTAGVDALGLDLLPPIADAAIPEVEVAVLSGGDLPSLRRLYPTGWRFRPAGTAPGEGSADLVILDPAPPAREFRREDVPLLRAARRRLVVGLERKELQRLGQRVDGHVAVNASETATAFGVAQGIRLVRPSLSYRHRRGGGCYWLAAEVA